VSLVLSVLSLVLCMLFFVLVSKEKYDKRIEQPIPSELLVIVEPTLLLSTLVSYGPCIFNYYRLINSRHLGPITLLEKAIDYCTQGSKLVYYGVHKKQTLIDVDQYASSEIRGRGARSSMVSPNNPPPPPSGGQYPMSDG
jgi:hypothetical protein